MVFLENSDVNCAREPTNCGRQPSRGFNSALLVAESDVRMVTHDDDPIHPQRVAVLMHFFATTDAMLVAHAYTSTPHHLAPLTLAELRSEPRDTLL